MVVVEHEIDGTTYWLRYAHIVPIVREGVHVKAGDKLGGFADWKTDTPRRRVPLSVQDDLARRARQVAVAVGVGFVGTGPTVAVADLAGGDMDQALDDVSEYVVFFL